MKRKDVIQAKTGSDGKQQGDVGGRQNRLRPALNGEGRGGGEGCGDGECNDEAERPDDVRTFDEGQAHGHEEGAKANLQQRQRLERDARRDVAECEAMEGKADGAAEGEHVAAVDGREIGQECGDSLQH